MPNQDIKYLKSSRVLIDTSAYEALRLDFSNKAILKLESACRNRDIILLTSFVIEREVTEHLARTASEVYENARKNSQRSYNLIPAPTLSKEEITTKIAELFTNHLKNCKALKVPLFPSTFQSTLDAYFDVRPPFSKDKKSEFKDAAVLFSLLEYCKSKRLDAYVISNDPDWKNFAANHPELHYLESLNEFLDIYNQHNELADKIKKYLMGKANDYDDKIARKIHSITFSNINQYMPVDETEIDNIEEMDSYVIDISEETATVAIGISTDVSLTVSYNPAGPSGYEIEAAERRAYALVEGELIVEVEHAKGDIDDMRILSASFECPSNVQFDFDPHYHR